MSRLPRWSIAALFGILTLAGLLWGGPAREMTVTSFGVLPPAYGALYDLLLELKLPVARSYARPDALPVERPVWWIAPASLCTGKSSADESMWAAANWLRRGGSAIVFLPEHCDVPAQLAGIAVPERQAAPAESGATEHEGAHGEEQVLQGALGAPRYLSTAGALRWFADAGADWQVRARITQHPFVVERAVGKGRLVLVADATFLTNAVLDHSDNSLLALDLVKAYGAPLIDEREHGLRAVDNPVVYLLGSPAALLLLAMLVLGSMYAWAGQLLPPRQLTASDTPPPTVAAFIDSVASLYRMSRDHRRVAEAYRDYTLARLRRHFGFAHDVADETVLQRLRSRHNIAPEAWKHLREPTPPDDEAALRRTVAAMDRLAEEVMR